VSDNDNITHDLADMVAAADTIRRFARTTR